MKRLIFSYGPFDPFLPLVVLLALACCSQALGQNGVVEDGSVLHHGQAKKIYTVFSQKTIRNHKDSLLRHGLMDKVKEAETINLSQDDYILKIREAFAGKTEAIPIHKNIKTGIPKSLKGATPGKAKAAGLSGYHLSGDGSEGLQHLYGYQLDTAKITTVKTRGRESAVEGTSKTKEIKDGIVRKIDVSPRQGFKERLFLESVFALSKPSEDGQVLYASPALAFRFLGPLSFGIGPDVRLNIKQWKEGLSPTIGIRSFLKASFWENRVYAQVEDLVSRSSAEGGESNIRHDFYTGGGYLVQLSPRLGINLSLLYHLNDNTLEIEGTHRPPWMFRFGLSILKMTEK